MVFLKFLERKPISEGVKKDATPIPGKMLTSGVMAGGLGGHVHPQRREKMGAPKTPSVLRGRQMPESLVQTKLRRDAQMQQNKVWAISPSQI